MSNTIQKAPKKKHISYSSREEYITDLEEILMQKYRVGYSALHKRLVVEKSNQLLNRTIWSDQQSTIWEQRQIAKEKIWRTNS